MTHDPYVPVELRKLDNVVLAPHNGGATWDSRGAQTSAIARSIVAAIKASGEQPVTAEPLRRARPRQHDRTAAHGLNGEPPGRPPPREPGSRPSCSRPVSARWPG